ncbi:MAG: NADAR domain-containing protein [Candidatus Dependentiae bacterium]|nr:NADAR domain-containing protein [Candidatus Dependentiae bacterium]
MKRVQLPLYTSLIITALIALLPPSIMHGAAMEKDFTVSLLVTNRNNHMREPIILLTKSNDGSDSFGWFSTKNPQEAPPQLLTQLSKITNQEMDAPESLTELLARPVGGPVVNINLPTFISARELFDRCHKAAKKPDNCHFHWVTAQALRDAPKSGKVQTISKKEIIINKDFLTILQSLLPQTMLLPEYAFKSISRAAAADEPKKAVKERDESGEYREGRLLAPTPAEVESAKNNWFSIPVSERILFYDDTVHPRYFVFSNYSPLEPAIYIKDFWNTFSKKESGENNWGTTEQYFQAMKFNGSGIDRGRANRELKEVIRAKGTAAADASKKLAKIHPACPKATWVGVDVWDKKSPHVMLTALRAKFDPADLTLTGKERVRQLLATNNKLLIEDTYKHGDKIWGAGTDGTGRNLLGQMLMHIRQEIKNGCSIDFVERDPSYYFIRAREKDGPARAAAAKSEPKTWSPHDKSAKASSEKDCPACTFKNPATATSCGICNTRFK